MPGVRPCAIGSASDEFIVPVCRVHHRDLYRSGDEATWWRRLNIDPVPVALKRWQQTRGSGEVSCSSEVAHAKTTEGVSLTGWSHDRNGRPDNVA
jgi:hypothetical protein